MASERSTAAKDQVKSDVTTITTATPTADGKDADRSFGSESGETVDEKAREASEQAPAHAGRGGGSGGGVGVASSNGKSPAEMKEDLAAAAQILREDAVEAMEEMRKRASRYRETRQDVDELASQMEGLEVDDKMSVYDKAFEQHPVAVGKAISKKERDATEQTGNSTLVYGEITFKTLALALHKIKTKYGLPGAGHSGDRGVLQEHGGVFYDIGSGTGKPVIAAAILHQFDRAVGIEILEGLHATSMEILKEWEGGLRDEIGCHPPTKVEFIHGDALDPDVCDWTDGDIVFANSTCFDDPFMRRLASAATALKKGSIFITLTKRLPATYFKVLEHGMYPMSWGYATVYMSQKTTDPYGDPADSAAGGRTE